jgi:hypothetical protein
MDKAHFTDPDILAALPELYQRWVEILPLADLLKLSEQYGGTRLYIPTTLNGSPALAERLGEEAARRLIDLAGGDTIIVPVCDKARRLVRCREVWRLHEQESKPLGVIAREFGVTDRTIQTMLRRERTRRAAESSPSAPAAIEPAP